MGLNVPPTHGSRRRQPGARRPIYVALALAGFLTVALGISFLIGPESGPELDEDLCSREPGAQPGRTVLLLDLTKPLGANTHITADVLHRVTVEMDAHAELQVFALGPDPIAPRVSVGRVCKPYANSQLVVETAKDRPSTTPDCTDLPAQLAPTVRDRAARFCVRRKALAQRIASMASDREEGAAPAAYLIEAIDDTRLELAGVAEPPSFYVFSDLVQHAAWYSHAERGPDRWDYGDFQRVRQRQTGLVGTSPPPDPDLAVTIFFVPRRGVTEHPRVALALERFWRNYFADVGSVTFERQPVQIGYDVRPLGSVPVDDGIDNPGKVPPPGGEPAESLVAAPAEETPVAEPRPPAEAAPAHDGEVEPDSTPAVADTGAVEPPPPLDNRADASVPEGVGEGIPERSAETVDESDIGIADASAQPEVGLATVPAPSPAVGADAETVEAGNDPQPGAVGNEPPIEIPTEQLTGPDRPPSAALGTDADQIDFATAGPPVDAPPCTVRLRQEFEVDDLYPRRPYSRRKANYGSAEIFFAYTIDEDGETVDDEVSFLPEQSSADIARHMPVFTKAAEEAIRAWQFDFDVEQGGCEKRQQRTIRFHFQYTR